MADIASEGIRHTRPAPAGQGRRRAAGIYGAIITAALLAAAGTKLPTDALVVSVVVTLVVYWLAEEYAELLGEQNRTGEPDLVPVRHGRMMISPFTFYRGATTIMAADLAGTPVAGLGAQLCGDAHLSNFGAFASPERTLVFDVNDFDETLPGPFEYDVKRMAASFSIAARNNGFAEPDARAVTLASVASYAWTCGWTLARAHARSGDPIAIAAWLGDSDEFDTAITELSHRYADQNERDYQAFVTAIRTGRLPALKGI